MGETVNAEFDQRACVDTTAMPWEPSPAKGVWRRKLDRVAAESGWTTSVVRYEAGHQFPAHTHPGGEEFLVLDGVFCDEHGDYPAGTYVRNPPGSSHAPFTREGCVIFVKLHQFLPGDRKWVRLNTHQGGWKSARVPGIELLELHRHGGELVTLVRWAPGAGLSEHVHPGGEEMFVVSGLIRDTQGNYPAGAWLRQPRLSRHQPVAGPEGALTFIKVGHLP